MPHIMPMEWLFLFSLLNSVMFFMMIQLFFSLNMMYSPLIISIKKFNLRW